MGVQKFLLMIVPLLLLYSFLQHCYGNAEALPFHKTSHPTGFSSRTSVAGKVGYWPRRALLASTSKVVNVNDYGAKGDGSSDDTKVSTCMLQKSICKSHVENDLNEIASRTCCFIHVVRSSNYLIYGVRCRLITGIYQCLDSSLLLFSGCHLVGAREQDLPP